MNQILKYTSKDYNSIYKDLIDSIPSLTDLWTNTNDGDPGIVLVKLMSALGDMLSYNLDKQALEYYSPTVTQRKNAAKLFKLIGYRMKWYQSATNRITVTNTTPPPIEGEMVINYNTWQDLSHDESASAEDKAKAQQVYNNTKTRFKTIRSYTNEEYRQYYNIPFGAQPPYELKPDAELIPLLQVVYNNWTLLPENQVVIYTDINDSQRTLGVYSNNTYESIPYLIVPTIPVINENYTSNTVVIRPTESADFDVIQGTLQSTTFQGNQLQNNRFYFIETAIDENNMWLSYSGATTSTNSASDGYIDKVEDLLLVTNGDIHFEFNVDEYDRPYIELSSYWMRKLGVDNTTKLPDTITFTVYYVRTIGVVGNITKNYLTSIENLYSSNITITHPTNTVAQYSDDIAHDTLIATPGKNPETAHEAYLKSLNYVTTFDSLVTIYDFERFCKRQPEISNAFAVDGQRGQDLNEKMTELCQSYELSQLQDYAIMSSEVYDDNGSIKTDIFNDLEALQNLYIAHKKVYKDNIAPINVQPNDDPYGFLPYQLQMYLTYGDFLITSDNYSLDSSPVATLHRVVTNSSSNIGKNSYLTYKIKDEYETPSTAEEIKKRECGITEWLDTEFNRIGVANVKVAYSPIRLFPWRCCGVLHLKAPVTEIEADRILETVIFKLQVAFQPSNLKFGQTLKYMDVINVVTNAHNNIRYFDAGLGNRKLIDIDSDVDFTYFNDTSLMYYVQRSNTTQITLDNGFLNLNGNNDKYLDINHTTLNPQYHLLSISPEYIIKT